MASEPVRGVEALNRAFSLASAEMVKELPRKLKYLSRPVERTAESLAVGIGAGKVWSPMRLGAGRRLVYIAPEARGTRVEAKKRRKFAQRLMRKAMLPALDANREQVGRGIDDLVARIVRRFNRG